MNKAIELKCEELSKEKGLSFEEITYRACDIIAEVMEEHLMDIQKINFDFGSLAVNNPERMAKIIAGTNGAGKTESIGIFISIAFSGIEKVCILNANYGTGSLGVKVEPKAAFKTLAKSIILLFGGKIDE